MNRYPTVLSREHARLQARSVNIQTQVANATKGIRALIKKDPDGAAGKLASLQEIVSRFEEEIRVLADTRAQFDKARALHESKLREAEKNLQELIVYQDHLQNKGYRLSEKTLSKAKKTVADAKALLSQQNDVPDYEKVIAHADGAKRHIAEAREEWNALETLRERNASELLGAALWLNRDYIQAQPGFKLSCERLQAATPEDVWKPIVDEACAVNEEAPRTMHQLMKEADEANDMKVQNFQKAASLIERIKEQQARLTNAHKSPFRTLTTFKEAEQKASQLLTGGIEHSFEDAEHALQDPDAEGAGRAELARAREELAHIKSGKPEGIPNWIAVATALAGVVALAELAGRNARSHAQAVQDERRRLQEAKERRRREEERRRREEEERREAEARRRREAEESRRRSWSTGGIGMTSSPGRSSFGGFGGGSFGGGGASGKW